MEKNSNDLLFLGISILIIGLLLASYSFSYYAEMNKLSTQIDFEEIANNNQISTTEKYYKYLSTADFLNQKLTKNQNILIKNMSCSYLDYAYHNSVELYNLTYKKMSPDDSKRSVTAGNIRSLYTMLDNYKTCKNTQDYKTKLGNILTEIEKANLNSYDNTYKFEKLMNEQKIQRSENNLTEENNNTQPELDPIPEDEQFIPKPDEQKQNF